MESKFKILTFGNLEYEELCTEVHYGDECVAVLNQEKGPEHLVIELHPRLSGDPWFLDYEEFLKWLEEAKTTLLEK